MLFRRDASTSHIDLNGGMVITRGSGGGGAAPSALLTDLISYWKLDEESGTRNDAHGTNHLTDNNTVLFGAGVIGNAADFEADNLEYLSCADNDGLSGGAGVSFTIAAWLSLESKVTFRPIFTKSDGTGPGTDYQLDYSASANRFRMITFNTASGLAYIATANNFGSPSLATLYHVVGWFNSATKEVGISVNAGTPNTTTADTDTPNSSGALQIGGQTSLTRYFDGLIDEVGFWKRVLAADERTQLYGGGAGLAYPFS